jgi:hypothetical protein
MRLELGENPVPSEVNRKRSPSSLYQQTTIYQITLSLAI